MEDGKGPTKELVCRPRIVIAVHEPMDEGIGPVNLLALSWKKLNLEREPTVVGMDPTIVLPETEKYVKPVRYPMDEESDPDKVKEFKVILVMDPEVHNSPVQLEVHLLDTSAHDFHPTTVVFDAIFVDAMKSQIKVSSELHTTLN
jgi:hypothetical protein